MNMTIINKDEITLCNLHARSLQSCLILRDHMDCSLLDSFVYGILQARIMDWVAIPS